jgi:hypothetical protein
MRQRIPVSTLLIPSEAGDWENYWRNRIADEIANERARVERYYLKQFPQGIPDEHTLRLNIFSLCEKVAFENK